ncbi:ABC transporter permease [Candidatus Magnetomonas plexicatena]|uniref:ABC transporter permease n=1 Tax=Candidatus Magnetomonas plexicatena TaxID=2552947 RepID=UPI001C7602D0|nr:ABC transporter permease [Nitrospirales bacterium LBB_01]
MPTAYNNIMPGVCTRVFAVWSRHVRVYTKNLFSNGFPPFVEPLIFLTGVGFGLGKYMPDIAGVRYVEFLASALVVTTSMMTAAFECSFGTFIRMEFNKVYEGMLAAPLSVENLLIGEMLWAATKGLFFSFAVLVIVMPLGIIKFPEGLMAPFVGFLTGFMFAALSLFVTSFVKSIAYFNFYMTGLLSPMFFFCGAVFPVSQLPQWMQPIVEILPLTHSVRLSRAFCLLRIEPVIAYDLLYIIIFTSLFVFLGIKRLKRRLID